MTTRVERSKAQLDQLRAWVDGNPYHDSVNNTCTPDFSCCRPHLLIPKEEREQFLERWLAGDLSFVQERCMGFLNALLEDHYKEVGGVYITTGEAPSKMQ